MLEPETIDGLMLEMRLAANPRLRERREAFWEKVRAFRGVIADYPRERLIADLKEKNPAYITSLLEAEDISVLRERYIHTFIHGWKAP